MTTAVTALSCYVSHGIAAERMDVCGARVQMANAGRYDKETKTGGSNGSTMRFAPERDHGANAGLKAARDFLEPVKGKICPKPHAWRS